MINKPLKLSLKIFFIKRNGHLLMSVLIFIRTLILEKENTAGIRKIRKFFKKALEIFETVWYNNSKR